MNERTCVCEWVKERGQEFMNDMLLLSWYMKLPQNSLCSKNSAFDLLQFAFKALMSLMHRSQWLNPKAENGMCNNALSDGGRVDEGGCKKEGTSEGGGVNELVWSDQWWREGAR